MQIEKQIEVVTAAVCEGKNFERPAWIFDGVAHLLERLEADEG
jgi:hypothetical protein